MQNIFIRFNYPGSANTYEMERNFVQISCCRSKFSKQPTEWKLRLTTRGSKEIFLASVYLLAFRPVCRNSLMAAAWIGIETRHRGEGEVRERQRETGKLEVLISK